VTTRLFKCKSCGHELRYGSARCGYCSVETPLRNRKGLVIALLVLSGFGLFIVAM
jgi:hypothetical protein